ncbi:MAG: hypothetical protein L3K26_19635 [Candidatus Hydrogenedentes bacterium]|nr:hypothetical protein [Candidatus Hydrogenedentota bacterium]
MHEFVSELSQEMASHGFRHVAASRAIPDVEILLKRQTWNTNRAVVVVSLPEAPPDFGGYLRRLRRRGAFQCKFFPFFWGIAAFAAFMTIPELKEAFQPGMESDTAIDTLFAMPVFLGRILPMGIIGIVTAAMIAAFMSTHDSYLLCWSTVLTNDVVIPLVGREVSQRAQIYITRAFIIAIGITILLISFFFPLKQSLWDFMSMTAALYFCGAFALLVAGLYWKPASNAGAYAALTAGFFAFMGFEDFRGMVVYHVLPISDSTADSFMEWATSAHIGLTTVALACTGMIIGSLLFPDKGIRNTTEETP